MNLDDFRNDAVFLDDDDKEAGAVEGSEPESGLDFEYAEPMAGSPRLRKRRGGGGQFLGMSAPQRLLLTALLFVEVCALGMFVLIATGRVVPPGMY